MSMSVIIADNHEITRRGVQRLVEGSFDARVVAMAGTGLRAVSAVERHSPRLLVLSLRLPHLRGLDVLHYVEQCDLRVEVLVLTMCRDETRVRTAFEKGACAYVLKRDSLNELCVAIETVLEGNRYLTGTLPEEYMDVGVDDGTTEPYQSLTTRERQVLQLTTEGYTSKEVGTWLHISSRTVDKHREHIRQKLGLESVVEMARDLLERRNLPNLHLLPCISDEERTHSAAPQ